MVLTTSSAHGYASGDAIHVAGASWLRQTGYFVANTTGTTLSLVGSLGPLEGSYAANAKIWCGAYGCSYRVFTTPGGSIADLPVTGCVTERTTNAYTDAAPSGSKLGYFYTSGGSCLGNRIVPLTSDIATLKTAIGPSTPLNTRTLVATGTTAGHLGLAWGWYMLAPNFSYLWPTASQPKAYNADNLIKAIIFMTDGLFNAEYCSGVLASDIAGCAGNGTSQAQALALCNAIKATSNDTQLFVVGFDLPGDTATLEFLRGCATSVNHFKQADDGSDLEAAFRDIAGQLSELRISK